MKPETLRDAIAKSLAGDSPAYTLELILLYRQYGPVEPFYQSLEGKCLTAMGRWSDAETVLLSVSGLEGELKASWENAVAVNYERSGRHDKAEEWFRRAVATCPGYFGHWVYLGSCLSTRERFDEAIAVLEQGLSVVEGRDELYVNIGNAHRACGRYKDAMAAYQAAFASDPDHPGVLERARDVRSALEITVMKSGNKIEGGN